MIPLFHREGRGQLVGGGGKIHDNVAHLNIDWVDLSTKYILNCVLTVFLYKNLDQSDSQVCKKVLIKSYQGITWLVSVGRLAV